MVYNLKYGKYIVCALIYRFHLARTFPGSFRHGNFVFLSPCPQDDTISDHPQAHLI